jgi:hypothetical protein
MGNNVQIIKNIILILKTFGMCIRIASRNRATVGYSGLLTHQLANYRSYSRQQLTVAVFRKCREFLVYMSKYLLRQKNSIPWS